MEIINGAELDVTEAGQQVEPHTSGQLTRYCGEALCLSDADLYIPLAEPPKGALDRVEITYDPKNLVKLLPQLS
jgi:hypothetical protein